MSGVEHYLTQWVQKNGLADIFVYIGCGVVPSNAAYFSYAKTCLLIDANTALQEVNEAAVAGQPGTNFIAQLVGEGNAQVSYNVYNFPRLNSTQPERDLLKRYPNAKLQQSNICDSVSLVSLLEKHTDIAASERILMLVDINGGEQSLINSLPNSLLQKVKIVAFKLAPENAYENAWWLDDARTFMESRHFSVYRYGNTAAHGACEVLFTFNDVASTAASEHQQLLHTLTEIKQALSEELSANAALHVELELSRSVAQDLQLSVSEIKQALSEEVSANAALHVELELSRSVAQDLHLDSDILTRQVESLEALRDAINIEHARVVENYEAHICQLTSRIEVLQAQCDSLESALKEVRESSTETEAEPAVFKAGALQRIEDRDHATQAQLLRAQTQIDLLKDLLVGRDKE